VRFVREMGLSHKEFLRTLPVALGEYSYKIEGHIIAVKLNRGRLSITLAPERVRKIAAFEIPITSVEFYFKDVEKSEKQSFMDYFEQRFRRGGG
jgi:hypothetical protein